MRCRAAAVVAHDRRSWLPAPSAAAQVRPAGRSPAQTPRPAADDGRFRFHRVDDGFLRLDTRTGQVSQCGRGSRRLGLQGGAGRARGARKRDRAAAGATTPR